MKSGSPRRARRGPASNVQFTSDQSPHSGPYGLGMGWPMGTPLRSSSASSGSRCSQVVAMGSSGRKSMPRVDISDGGRAGSITYREGLHTVSFSWEFALSPALAVINGPTAREWARLGEWAAGRQEEIFQHVAGEVIRQKAKDHDADIDLAAGTITVLERARRERGKRGASPASRDVLGAELAEGDVEELIALILRDEMSG